MCPARSETPAPQDPDLDLIIGLGKDSMRKSYYPELQRRLSELERFRTLFDAGHDLILLAQLPRGIVTDANLPACRRLGWSREELLGLPLSEILEGGDLDALLTGKVLGEPAHLETYFRSREGGVFPVELTCRVAADGRRYGVESGGSALIVARDITDRRCFECQLHAAKEMAERASLAKSKFLAAASHDLRQPAQSLSLFTALLHSKLKGHPAASVVDHLETSVDALRLLLDGLLDVSRLDAGLVVATPKAFPINALLAPLRAEYEMRAAEKELRLVVLPSRLWVFSDPVLLETMLRNLIENAIRYTQAGAILVGCRPRGTKAVLEVRDSGIGMTAEQQENIFEEFYQVGNSERDRRHGLGLGLAIVRRLSQLLGHEIKVKSRAGHGSCFTIRVKRGTPEQTAPPPPEPAAATCPGMSILVIDDEKIVRSALRMLLESWGCRVRDAASSEEAIQVGGADCQFILADYRLKGETGPDAIERLHAAAGRVIPALIITGDTAPDCIAEVAAHGYRILHKPITAERLRAAICGDKADIHEGCDTMFARPH
jgi:PAS domain S-box-containing protein